MRKMTPRRRADSKLRCVETVVGNIAMMQHALAEARALGPDPNLDEIARDVEALRAKLVAMLSRPAPEGQ
jgi:hypothetical protein